MTVFKELIYYILSSDFKFKQSFTEEDEPDLVGMDDVLLNYSMKRTCCEIIFNLYHEKDFFTVDKISECLHMVVRFVMSTFFIESRDEKSFLILGTIKMISHLIINGQNLTDLSSRIQQIEALLLIKESILFNQISLIGINIEAMNCVTNMMNINAIALQPQMIEMQHETFGTYFLSLYLMFGNQLELEEATTNYLWAMSLYPDPYIYLLRDRLAMILNLMDNHTKAPEMGV